MVGLVAHATSCSTRGNPPVRPEHNTNGSPPTSARLPFKPPWGARHRTPTSQLELQLATPSSPRLASATALIATAISGGFA